MRKVRIGSAAVLAAVTLLALLGTSASAAVAKRVATVECEGASVTLIMHPGEGGKAIWDISYENVQNAPSYLIKKIEGEVFAGGELVGTLDVSVGKKTGFGEPLTCAFEVHDGFDVYGSLELVRL